MSNSEAYSVMESEEDMQVAMSAGSAYFYGTESMSTNYEQAIKNFELALSLGSTEALVFLGRIYSDDEFPRRNSKKSLEYFKQAINSGDFESYPHVASMYEKNNMIDKAVKCWDRYMSHDTLIDPHYGFQYISFCFSNNIEIKRTKGLFNCRNYIIHNMVDYHEQVTDDEILGRYYELLYLYFKKGLRGSDH